MAGFAFLELANRYCNLPYRNTEVDNTGLFLRVAVSVYANLSQFVRFTCRVKIGIFNDKSLFIARDMSERVMAFWCNYGGRGPNAWR